MAAGGSIGERIAAAATRRRIVRRLADLDLTPNQTLRDEIEEWAAEHGDRPTLLSDDRAERLSPTGLAGRAHRWARWTILHGVGRGERVALILANRPERLAAWIGVAETGAVAALLDAALPPEALAAAIAATGAAHVVVDAPLLPRFEAAAPHLTALAAVWVFGPHPMAYLRIDEALDDLSSERLRPADRRPVAADDDALWLVGPDGAVRRCGHRAALRRLHAAAAACRLRPDDRLFVPDIGLADTAAPLVAAMAFAAGAGAILAAADAPVTAGTTLLVRDGRRPPETDTAPPAVAAKLRLALAIGGDAAAPGRDEATAPPKRLVWRDGTLATAGGLPLWRDTDV